jgi:hypothetical protein
MQQSSNIKISIFVVFEYINVFKSNKYACFYVVFEYINVFKSNKYAYFYVTALLQNWNVVKTQQQKNFSSLGQFKLKIWDLDFWSFAHLSNPSQGWMAVD